ncbi:MAG: YopX family protein [Lachnospiraceae bacterium]|nr:YopX family protein [Lachnospiraceae bacterium]
MNDRYLCRAKRTDNGEWVEGYIVVYPSGRCNIHKKCTEPPDVLAIYEIDPSTICQCTGLKDKNGKLIWENDIVKHFYNKDEPERYDIGVVRWDDVQLSFRRTSKIDEKLVNLSFYSAYEVIGSEIDNSELLKVANG